MFKIQFRHRVISAFFSVIIIPLFITVSFLFLYGRYLYIDDSDNFTLSAETVVEIEDYITDNWHFLKYNYRSFHLGLTRLIDNKPIGLRIIKTNSDLVYDSSVDNDLPTSFEMFEKIIPGLEAGATDTNTDFLTYTVGKYITIDGEVQGMVLYTYPPPPEFMTKFLRLLLWTFVVGFSSLLIHVSISVYLISKRVTMPLKELYVAIEKISKNDFDFDISYTATDELGTLCHGFQTMKNKLKDFHQRELEATETKKQLVASISHDLRTPMTSIQGYVEALQDGLASDPKKFNHYLSVIQKKVEGLNRLIDDLFELSKLDIGQLNLTKERIHVKSFIQDFYIDIKEDAGWKGIILSKQFINIDCDIIDADTARLEQALSNVVFNAFKFSRKEVVLQCHCCEDHVHFTVVDDGPGIPHKEVPFIFDKFYKVEKARTTNSGSGLGLAIAKGIITQMGGTIIVSNNNNRPGASFTISLPLVK